MGNPLYVNFNQPQYVFPKEDKPKLGNTGNKGQRKHESNPEKSASN